MVQDAFFEGSARVPLMISAPDLPTGPVGCPVSTLEVTPTLADLVGLDLDKVSPWTDGETLVPLTHGGEQTSPVLMEYAAEGSYAPLVAIRRDNWKFISCKLGKPQLFDLLGDPHELTNLAEDPFHAKTLAAFQREAETIWDLDAFDREVRQSQARRHVVYKALRNGAYYTLGTIRRPSATCATTWI